MITLFIIYYVITTLTLLYDMYCYRDIAYQFSPNIIIFSILVALLPVINIIAMANYIRWLKD